MIDHYLKGSVVAYDGERLEEIIAAEQGGLPVGEAALLELLDRKLRREPPRLDPETEAREVKKAIALKLLKSSMVRRTAVRALKNKTVRSIVARQIRRRVFGK